MHAQLPRFESRLPARRTLARDHSYFAGMLRAGSSVLDVGCANGALTAGMAEAVGPDGKVVGVDREAARLDLARSEYRGLTNLFFEVGDATSLDYHGQFDFVTAARTLQWLPDPALTIAGMKEAAKPNGTLVVLDFNHVNHVWEPEPPSEFRVFYQALLDWRSSKQYDNRMADHLPELFRSAGLIHVETHVQDEIVERGDPEFAERVGLWCDAMEGLGATIVEAGFLSEDQLHSALECFPGWIRTGLQKQTLQMRTVTGTLS